MKYRFTVIWMFCLLSLQAQQQSQLSIKEIMTGEDFVGYLPSSVQWSEDSKEIYFSWNPDMDTLRSYYSVDIKTEKIRKLTDEEDHMRRKSGDKSKDGTSYIFENNGDLFFTNLKTFQTTQLTNTVQYESGPTFLADQNVFVYRSDNNLFTRNLKSGEIKQITNFEQGRERNSKESEADLWLEEDQLAWFDIIKERDLEDKARSKRNDQIRPKRPKTIYLEDQRLMNPVLSGDGKVVFYGLYKDGKDPNTIVPDYVTKSGYTKDLNARSKVGHESSSYEAWIYNIEKDTTYEIKAGDLPGIYDKPKFLADYDDDFGDGKSEKPKTVRINSPTFSDAGRAVLNVTSEDNKDRWITLLNTENGELSILDHQHDEAWIGGPGVGWFSGGRLGWIDEENVYFQSEKTGYSHLYVVNVNSGKIDALTSGNWEVLNVELSANKKTFFMTTNEVSPHQHHFYQMSVKGGKRTQITSHVGGHDVTMSPDEKQLAILYSYSNKPWELFVMENKPNSKMRQLTTSTTEKFNAYNWRDPEIVMVKAKDGAMVPATLYSANPEKKNNAAVIFVHGAGYLQNVHQWWSSYYREYMFNNFLADNGYTVLALDFRASAGYGRDWRTAIYRHMGGKDLDDQVDGAKYLVENHEIDPGKIGLYGGSYGGFITLMGLFNYPETFKSGAALRSVTDWAHYNHGYTSNILNTPVLDSIAYRRSSPIYFAEGLEGNLLMLHGMVDTNVHFQDVVRLSQRLIELEKENWELAVFPMESHGFVEASSWADEYRRIYELFQETLIE